MSKQLNLDAVQRQINAAQIDAWLPLEIVRVLELAPLLLDELRELRAKEARP